MDSAISATANVILQNGLSGAIIIVLLYAIWSMRKELQENRKAHIEDLKLFANVVEASRLQAAKLETTIAAAMDLMKEMGRK